MIKRRGKSMNQSCWKWFKLLFCFILMNLFLFGLSKTERAPKPLLGCQNWDTSMGGCQNLVPGWHTHRRGWCGLSHVSSVKIPALNRNVCSKVIQKMQKRSTGFWTKKNYFQAVRLFPAEPWTPPPSGYCNIVLEATG